MNEAIKNKLVEAYNKLIEKPIQVFNIFRDFYGDEYVDFQPSSIDFFLDKISHIVLAEYMVQPFNMTNESWKIYKRRVITSNEFPEDVQQKLVNKLNDYDCIRNMGVCANLKYSIYVHFPKVRITNENNRFVDITHLYAKINVRSDGRLNDKFYLNRSEYPSVQFIEGYMHSHISCISYSNLKEFIQPCTGTGPINGTMEYLRTTHFENTEQIWQLFCLELSKFVTVESLKGVPYNYLEKIGTHGMACIEARFQTITSVPYFPNFDVNNFKEFTAYLINLKKLKFNYKKGSYSIGMSFIQYLVFISNAFIDWYNKKYIPGMYTLDSFLRRSVLLKCVIKNNKIYSKSISSSNINYRDYIGKELFTFKGQPVTLNIIDTDSQEERNMVILLNPKIALYILSVILKVLNYEYGKDNTSNSTDTSTTNNSSTKVWYL